MGWLILASVVVAAALMAASYLLAMYQSRSTIQASTLLLEQALLEAQRLRIFQQDRSETKALRETVEAMSSTLATLDVNVGEMATRLSEGGHLRTREFPKGLGPRGSWGGGEEGSGRSGTPA